MILFTFTTDHTGGIEPGQRGHARDHRALARAPRGDLHARRRAPRGRPDRAGGGRPPASGRGGAPAVRDPLHPRRRAHVWVSISLSLLRSRLRASAATGIAQVQDVTDSKLASEELAYQALHDPLTGLGNRRSLLADLQARLDAATLRAAAAAPAVRPRRVQDLQRHLRAPGRRCAADPHGAPSPDRARRARVRLSHGRRRVLRAQPARLRRPRLDRRHRRPTALTERGEGFQVTASYGSVTLPAEATTATEALREADRRMYARKSLGQPQLGRAPERRRAAEDPLRAQPRPGRPPRRGDEPAEAVAERLGLPDEERAPLLQAASLHDVGKAAIPDEILDKQGPLDDEEWEFMRRHTADRRAHPVGRPRADARPRGWSARATSASTARATRTGSPERRDPARVAHHRGLRRLRRDGVRPPLPLVARARARRSRSCAAARARSSTPRWSRCSPQVLLDAAQRRALSA